MKHIKRMSIGLVAFFVLFWPFIVWWNNVAMAEAIMGIWFKVLLAVAGIYAVGWAVMKIRGKHGD